MQNLVKQLVFCSLKSQLVDQEGELPDFLTKILSFCLDQNELRPIMLLNSFPVYKQFASEDRFNYFDQSDSNPNQLLNHVELEYV